MDLTSLINAEDSARRSSTNTAFWIDQAVEEAKIRGGGDDVASRWKGITEKVSPALLQLDPLLVQRDGSAPSQARLAADEVDQAAAQCRELARDLSPPDGDPDPDVLRTASQCVSAFADELQELCRALRAAAFVPERHWADPLVGRVAELSSAFPDALNRTRQVNRITARHIADDEMPRRQRQRLMSIEDMFNLLTTSVELIGQVPTDQRTQRAACVGDLLAEICAACKRAKAANDLALLEFHAAFRREHSDDAEALYRFAENQLKPMWEFIAARLPDNVRLQAWPR